MTISRKMKWNMTHLPASQIAGEVNEALEKNNTLVVTAPPGAGKSTLLPLTILDALNGHGDTEGKILMLEPRRLAARQIAGRMASIMAEPVGKTVGYRVRFDSRVTKDTRIEVLTEGILTRMLVGDPTLDGISTIIFDEFHERSINSDLALALALQAQSIVRPDLRIVIMSATIDSTAICQSLHAPLVECQGRIFPVDIIHEDTSPYGNSRSMEGCAQAAAAITAKAHREHEGDILVFLPGQSEIQKCRELLGSSLSPTSVLPLYGNLSSEEQHRAIAPSKDGERKVVLATPIAETSLTIEGVRIVIDSGLYKKLVFDPNTGLSHLETVRISMDMATQRTGRAGRVAEGVCYRLWSKTSEHLMAERRTAEIEEADLAGMLLDVASFGESKVETLPWLTLLPKQNMLSAKKLLLSLEAIKEVEERDGSMGMSITPLGRKMEALPCHPRIARMILSANTKPQQALACDIAALLEEKDPMADSGECDITLRLSMLRHCRSKNTLGRWTRIAQIAKEYRRMVRAEEDNLPVDGEDAGLLLAHAYPERIAKATDSIGGFKLAGGNKVSIGREDPMSARSWIAIASLNRKVFLAAPLDINYLQDLTRERERIDWDSKQGMVVMRKERCIGSIVVDSKPIQDADKRQVINIVCEAVKKEGLSMLDWNEQVQRLQRRVAKVAEWHPELGIPDLSTAHLLTTANDWLALYLEENGKVKCSTAELRKLDLPEILWNCIPYDQQQAIDRLAPTHVQVPTGSSIRIDYRQGAGAPVLSVRLQECFGMEQTPCVNGGGQPLLMELLSPGFKPVQLTQDLRSFWQSTYFEVRKELKRRYPKHYWPENPLEAEAVRGVKRR